jgi:hypothetical protein
MCVLSNNLTKIIYFSEEPDQLYQIGQPYAFINHDE